MCKGFSARLAAQTLQHSAQTEQGAILTWTLQEVSVALQHRAWEILLRSGICKLMASHWSLFISSESGNKCNPC